MEADVVGFEDGAVGGGADATTVATTNVVLTAGMAGDSNVLNEVNVCLEEEAPTPDDIEKLSGVGSDGWDAIEDIVSGSVDELSGIPNAEAVALDKELVDNEVGTIAGRMATGIPLARLVETAVLEEPSGLLDIDGNEAVRVVEEGLPTADATKLFEVASETALGMEAIVAVVGGAIAGEIVVMAGVVVSKIGVDSVVMTVDESESGGDELKGKPVLAATRIAGAAADLELARLVAVGLGEESGDEAVKDDVDAVLDVTVLELELRMTEEEFCREDSLPAVVLVEVRTSLAGRRDDDDNRVDPAGTVEVVIVEDALVLT